MNVFDFLNAKLRKNSEYYAIHIFIHCLLFANSTADIPVASGPRSKNLNIQVLL